MAVPFEDYYETLGVARTAAPEEIKRAYRKLARDFHPDRNKAPDAAARFARISEAYEVLSDAEKRKKYDALGANWKAGQEFRPPPGSGFDNVRFEFRGGRGGGGGGGFSPGGFSEFFETLFGGGHGRGGAGAGVNLEDFLGGGRPRGMNPGARPGTGHRHAHAPEQQADVAVSLHEAFHGSTRRLELQTPAGRKSVEVKVPPGTTDGSRIRLRGEGLVLRFTITPDPRFELDGRDLITDVPLAPWEAALGNKVTVPTMDGDVTVTIPPGSSSGQRLRLKGKGLPARKSDTPPGDLYARLKIVLPKALTNAERQLYEQLRDTTHASPRP